ncbi:hypothetical protein PHMEG_0009909 [Phytophthora megakarya]|uniref:DUF3668 domain-containing protein n=1 Tax=Phytophthora megakarya TaxID=4795 RepID=A0A225WFX9_9STRA|nr:hypothetical protein PHMEG_0009909 [Phytophthora megakarya]
MSVADPDNDDAYGSDDYEPESPTRPQPSPTRSQHSAIPPSIVQQQQLTFQFDTDAASDSEIVTPLPTPKSKRTRTARVSSAINGRHLMDNTQWIYSVSALQVRMLRIPVTESAAIRELRMFATIDKQAAQSRGSTWKQELHSVGGGSPLPSIKRQRKKSRSSARMERYRRSGHIEGAKWVKNDGKLQWTFPMEKFRRLKAYAPRIKAFVYGISEVGVENHHSRTQMDNLVRQEKEGAILSFGWFFLDLRTPDLPERWLKLQNSPFGGEILVSSAFLPVELTPQQPDTKSMPQFEDKMSNMRRQTGTTAVKTTKAKLFSGESGEFLQIGDGNGHDIFVLSIFIQSALNLSKLVETSTVEDPQSLGQTGYWLSYSLFDVVVQTDVFYNLIAAEFSPIRDSFRVKSSLKDLTHCIEALGNLTVFMCTENQVLAGVEIPLRPLLSKTPFANSGEIENALWSGQKSEIEGEFSFPDFDEAIISASFAVELVESNHSKGTNIIRRMSQTAVPKQEIDIGELDEPALDVQADTTATKTEILPAEQILFKLEYLRLKTSTLAPFIGEENVSVEMTLGEERVSGSLVFCSYTKQQAFATCPALGVVHDNVSSEIMIGIRIHIRCFSTVSERLVASSVDAPKIVQDDEGYPKAIVLTMINESKQQVGQCTLGCTRGMDSHQKLGRELTIEPSGNRHHYRICLKLKAVKDVSIPGGYSLRYLNPFLSLASVSSDWFTVKDKGDVEAVGFYCMFDLRKDSIRFKQEMQESVSIDLISSDEER